MRLNDWPRNKQNRLKLDDERLPIEIPGPRFLADFNCHIKTVRKFVNDLATLLQNESHITKDVTY